MGNQRFHLFQVAPVARQEVIQADDLLIQLEERLQEIRPYEAGNARNEPFPWFFNQGFRCLTVTVHFCHRHFLFGMSVFPRISNPISYIQFRIYA